METPTTTSTTTTPTTIPTTTPTTTIPTTTTTIPTATTTPTIINAAPSTTVSEPDTGNWINNNTGEFAGIIVAGVVVIAVIIILVVCCCRRGRHGPIPRMRSFTVSERFRSMFRHRPINTPATLPDPHTINHTDVTTFTQPEEGITANNNNAHNPQQHNGTNHPPTPPLNKPTQPSPRQPPRREPTNNDGIGTKPRAGQQEERPPGPAGHILNVPGYIHMDNKVKNDPIKPARVIPEPPAPCNRRPTGYVNTAKDKDIHNPDLPVHPVTPSDEIDIDYENQNQWVRSEPNLVHTAPIVPDANKRHTQIPPGVDINTGRHLDLKAEVPLPPDADGQEIYENTSGVTSDNEYYNVAGDRYQNTRDPAMPKGYENLEAIAEHERNLAQAKQQ